MDVTAHYLKGSKQKKVDIELDIREAKLLLFSLKRDPQKSAFSKRLIEQVTIYIQKAEEYEF